MDDKRIADRAGLDPFVQQHYDLALAEFRKFAQRSDLDDRDRAKTHFHIATCLFELYLQERAQDDWREQFQAEVAGYLTQLDPRSLDRLAPDRLKDCFRLVLRFHIEATPVEEMGERARETYQAFVRRTAGKVPGSEYLEVALSLIEQERRNYARPDHARRAASLAEAVLQEIGDNDGFRPHRTAIYNLLADLAYFFPLSSEDDHQRYKRVSGYLEKAFRPPRRTGRSSIQ